MVQNFEPQHLHSRKKKQKQKQKQKQNKTKQKTYYTLFIMYIDFPTKCDPLIIYTSISARFRVFCFVLFCFVFFMKYLYIFANIFCSVFLFLYLALFWFEYGQIKLKKKKNDSRLLPKLSLPLRQKSVTPMIGKSAVKFIWFQNW